MRLLPGRRDIVLGTTAWPLPLPVFALTPEEQAHHAAIFGRTGSGKSRLLQSLFLQHHRLGNGVGIIEPHHDLSFDTLSALIAAGVFDGDEAAFERVVYLDWGNGHYVPFNVLANAAGVLPQTLAANVYEAMLRAYPELIGAPRFKRLFVSSLIVLIVNRLPITFLYKVLTDSAFRQKLLPQVEHPITQQVFQGFARLKDWQQEELSESVLNRAHHLSYSPYTELTLGQPENRLDFRRLMDEGRALIINLGNVADHEARRLIGALLLVQIEQAALSRTDQLPQQRRPFTLLIDEWPSFAAQAETLGTILSQTRKFQLQLYLAAQSLFQIGTNRLRGALENCRLNIAFGLGRDSAEIQARQIARIDPYAVKEEGLTETQHAQYLSLAEQYELWAGELRDLSPRSAYVKLHNHPARKIKTVNVPDATASARQIERVTQTYQRRYQRSESQARAAIATLPYALLDTQPQPQPAAYTRLFPSDNNQPN